MKESSVSLRSRETFSSRIGFVVAALGASIGMGNIWMFPYRLGAYGGAAFLVPYLIFVFLLASVGLMGEFGLGRSNKGGSISAFDKVYKQKKMKGGALLGLIPVLAQVGVMVFYAIVVGWILKYFFLSVSGALLTVDSIPKAFGGFVGTSKVIYWHALALIITGCIVACGVRKGIERVSKVIMPLLFFIFAILLFKTLTLEGSMEGVKFLLVPDWSYLLKPVTWVMALGQAFFTVSLGGAGMVVLGSYLKDDENIPKAAIYTVTMDTLAAFLVAFIIIPAAFAFNIDHAAGPPLLFITIPEIYKAMSGGAIFACIFFLSVVFAGISTLIILMEVAVEEMKNRLELSRVKSVIVICIVAFIAGVPMDTDMHKFHVFIDVVTVYLVPIGAVLAAITFFWINGIDKARQEIQKGSNTVFGKWFDIWAKYVFVIVSVVVLILGIIYGGIG